MAVDVNTTEFVAIAVAVFGITWMRAGSLQG